MKTTAIIATILTLACTPVSASPSCQKLESEFMFYHVALKYSPDIQNTLGVFNIRYKNPAEAIKLLGGLTDAWIREGGSLSDRGVTAAGRKFRAACNLVPDETGAVDRALELK